MDFQEIIKTESMSEMEERAPYDFLHIPVQPPADPNVV